MSGAITKEDGDNPNISPNQVIPSKRSADGYYISLRLADSFGPWVGGYELPAWYAWRVENWGTKWDVADVQMTNPLMIHGEGKSSFSFNCWTAWSPPIPVWDKLVEMGLSVDADYQDEGFNFEGTYLNGEDKCWEPELDEEEEV